MIIVMKSTATDEDIQRVVARLSERGYGHNISRGVERIVIGAIGAPDGEKAALAEQLSRLPNVEKVVPILRPYKLVSREYHPETSPVRVGDFEFGRAEVGVIAGPCSIESREQLLEAAMAVKEAGAVALRGGAFKPRTSPYSFQGLKEEGLKLLAEAREATGLPVVTEVTDLRQVELVAEYADCIQIGARNMQNYDLLVEVGRAGKPVLLKRGFAATVQEWLQAAEYIADAGNLQIILCERGIRTFETSTRFTLDLGGAVYAKQETHLPIIADPSHATGMHTLVDAASLAAIAAGLDGLIVEVHPRPEEALSDGPQSLKPDRFRMLMEQLAAVARAVGRELRT
ncbi:MAG: 3-deoxy-7-phosphoheptulonate synthase [Armatimonadetes bacterium]|nr:3-deoxy-7-phosphoheptulonate synthase [Armatimonadota bacterium]